MVTSRRGLGDWVEPLSTEVPQIPAQPALDSRAPFTPLRAPVHAQGELGSEVVRVFGEGGVAVDTNVNSNSSFNTPKLETI